METTDKTTWQRWLDLLTEEGYRPHREEVEEHPERSVILFKAEGARFSLTLDDTDAAYRYLLLSYVLGDVTDDAVTLLAAANEVNAEVKGTKVSLDLDEHGAYFTMEWFAEDPPSGKQLGRMIDQCRHGADTFFAKVRALAKPRLLA